MTESIQFSLRQRMGQIGLGTEALDAMVHDAASDMATNANNGGVKSQLEFLLQGGFSDERIWAGIVLERLAPGLAVDVSAPQHPDSAHQHAFTGTVMQVCDDYVLVEDMDGNGFDIDFSEIVCFEGKPDEQAA